MRIGFYGMDHPIVLMRSLFVFFTSRLEKYNRRSQKAIKNILFSLSIKGISVIISFAMIPLLVKTLTPVTYGIWLTLISLVNILNFSDVGLGNGLKNLLTEAIAKNNEKVVNELITTAYIIITLICISLFAVFNLANNFLQWDQILNAPFEMRAELNRLVLVVVFFFCLQLILKMIVSIFYAYQQSSVPDLINLLGQALSYVGVVCVAHFGTTTLLTYGVIISGMPVFVLIFTTLFVFKTKYLPITFSFRYFNKSYLRDLCTLGGKFFLIQITAYLLYQSNNMIISHTVGNLDVTIYNIAYKYGGATQLIFMIILSPLWAASTDAFVKKDFYWIRNTVGILNKIWLFLVLIGIVQIILSGKIYLLWIGQEVQIGWTVTALCILYFILSMKAGIYCYIINGSGKIFMQFVLYIIQVLIHIPLAIYLGKLIGIQGVLISMCIIMLMNVVWMRKQYYLLVNQKLHGIWNR